MKNYQLFVGLAVLVLTLSVCVGMNKPLLADGKLIGGVADGCPCKNDSSRRCTSTEGNTCLTNVIRCDDGVDGNCTDHSGAGSLPCSLDSKCVSVRMQSCN